MAYPLTAGKDGIKVMPEHMEDEKLYHCMFGEKVMLLYRDNQKVLHCYEIEEPELVGRVRECADNDEAVKVLEEYVAQEAKSPANPDSGREKPAL